MSCMGRCVKHGCAFSARLIDGTRDEYCPECEIDHLRTALATAQAERSEALAECNCAVLERDAALQRAEQAPRRGRAPDAEGVEVAMTDAELVSELRANVERSHPAWSMAPTVLAAAEAIERLTARLTLAQAKADRQQSQITAVAADCDAARADALRLHEEVVR